MGTAELLLTAPIRDWELVLGKFVASVTFFVATLALTLYYVVLLYAYGSPGLWPHLEWVPWPDTLQRHGPCR